MENGDVSGKGNGRGGKAKRNNRQGGEQPRDVLISKKLSWLLRHGAEGEGLKLGSGGYAPLLDVLNNRKIKPLKVTLAEVRQIVTDSEKQRFSLVHKDTLDSESNREVSETKPPTANKALVEEQADEDPSHYHIRANQGHSVKVEEEGLLKPITIASDNLPAIVVHGTRHQFWPRIVASGGLRPMTRNHVHFATGIPESMVPEKTKVSKPDTEVTALPDKKDAPVTLSGMRASSTVLIYLDLQKALNSGLKFWMSQNGVVLTDGGDGKLVSMQYFKRVEERDGNLLVENGNVVGELVSQTRK